MSQNTFKLKQVSKNKNDPLTTMENAETPRQTLFKKFGAAADGFQYRDIVYAAASLIINAIRQECKTSTAAEKAFDEFATKTKACLIDQHYHLNGKRRGVFPFTQIIQAPIMSLWGDLPQEKKQ